MKVSIGRYPNSWMSRIHTNYMNKKYGYGEWYDNTTRFEGLLEKLEDGIQWVYNHTVNLYYDNAKQKVNVRIDYWDTWGMDCTLSHIIVPMLKQLKETKHGAPYVDISDVPKELHPPKQDVLLYKKIGETDEKFFERWDWVLDEMIWAFTAKIDDDLHHFVTDDGFDEVAYKEFQERMSNGFRLFGKYYDALWD